MSYKTLFSAFLTGQLRAMSDADAAQFRAKMTEIRTGVLSHHKVLQGTGDKAVLKKVGKTIKGVSVEEASCGLGGKWRIFFYRTGWQPKNTLEAERRKNALGKSGTAEVPDGTLWCALIGHLEGGDLELFVGSANADEKGAKTKRKTQAQHDEGVADPAMYKAALKAVKAENAELSF